MAFVEMIMNLELFNIRNSW